jgi:phosphate transport system substrate-binding protein
MGTMRELAKAFSMEHPHIRVSVVPNLGSSGGIKAVASGVLDIGLSSRPLKESAARRGLKATEYARTPFVFATSYAGASAGLALRKLADIYACRLGTWPDGSQIRVVLRPMGDSDTDTIQEMSPEMAEAVKEAHSRRGMITAVTDQDSADLIEKVHGGIGTSTLALMVSEKRPIRALSIDGVRPSVEALAGGQYPYYKSFYIVTGAEMTPAARAFFDFVLSEEGTAVLARTGNLATSGRR